MNKLLLVCVLMCLSTSAFCYGYEPARTTRDVVEELNRERAQQEQEARMKKMERAQEEMERKMKKQEWNEMQERTQKTLRGNQ